MSSTPDCYGKHWEAHHPVCFGGLDPTFVHPERKDHRHDPCPFYSSCAAKTAAAKLSTPDQSTTHTQKPIPPEHLMRPQPTMPVPFQRVVQQYTHQGGQTAAAYAANIQLPQINIPYAHPAPAPMAPSPVGAAVHPAHASFPWQVPMNYQAPGSQMPAYLTVPEPIYPGEGTFKPLMRTVLRSVLKAGCHSMANFFDHVPFTPWPQPPVQG